MRQIYPDLWQGQQGNHYGLTSRAYLLSRENGNVLFYYTRSEKDLDVIEIQGGANYQYLSHIHEVNNSLSVTGDRLNSKLVGHHLLKSPIAEFTNLDVPLNLTDNTFHAEDIQVIPTPGHTATNLCYHYKSPFEKSYLFVGDTIYRDRGVWKTLILPGEGGSRREMMQSLERLKQLEVDVIICSVSIGENEVVEVNQKAWISILNKLIDQLF